MKSPARFSEDTYLGFDLFTGDRDIVIRCVTRKIVNTRTVHICASPIGRDHQIPPGTLCRWEKANIDGRWGSYWTCIACVDGWLTDVEGLTP